MWAPTRKIPNVPTRHQRSNRARKYLELDVVEIMDRDKGKEKALNLTPHRLDEHRIIRRAQRGPPKTHQDVCVASLSKMSGRKKISPRENVRIATHR